MKVVEAAQMEYVSPREAADLKAFVTTQFPDNRPNGLITGLQDVDVRIGKRGH